MEILQRLNVERGLTILLVTHEHEIAEYAMRTLATAAFAPITRSPFAGRPPFDLGSPDRGRARARVRVEGMSLFMTCVIAYQGTSPERMRTALTASA
jgi:hypothetical protein